LSAAFVVVAAYRLGRFCYLLFGPAWGGIRLVFQPLALLLRPWLGACEIHYGSDIGPGLKILHPALGVVVSKHARIGRNCVLVGGNCLGGRKRMQAGDLMIGDGVLVGANAVVLGPARIGDGVRIGAGAVVVGDAPDRAVLVGVPARVVGAGGLQDGASG
jgi:serine acetyltransferase